MKHNASVIGLDIAKNIFYAVGVDAHGHEVLKRKLTRNQVLAFFANLPAARVGIEARASAHYWARQINALGHQRAYCIMARADLWLTSRPDRYTQSLSCRQRPIFSLQTGWSPIDTYLRDTEHKHLSATAIDARRIIVASF